MPEAANYVSDDGETIDDSTYEQTPEPRPPVDLTVQTAKRIQALYSSYFAWLEQMHSEMDQDYLVNAAVELVHAHIKSQGY